jgi:hypothetical protein
MRPGSVNIANLERLWRGRMNPKRKRIMVGQNWNRATMGAWQLRIYVKNSPVLEW